MKTPLRIVLAQFNALVGDIPGNAKRIAEQIQTAREQHRADIVVFPELALTGYPPEDLLLRPGFLRRAQAALHDLKDAANDCDALIGFPEQSSEGLYNACAWLGGSAVKGVYRKSALPNYAVFDEKRYFRAGGEPLIVNCRDWRVGVAICEDMWEAGPSKRASEAGAEVLLAPHASPYCLGKRAERVAVTKRNAEAHQAPIAHCNLVGGQDELVFDGQSFAVDARGRVTGSTPVCGEGLFPLTLDPDGTWQADGWPQAPLDEDAEVWAVLQCGLRDYVDKNGFPGVLIGLSGGIDSALAAVLATQALGADRVTCVSMPSRYTAEISVQDTQKLVDNLGVTLRTLPIQDIYDLSWNSLKDLVAGRDTDIARQNLQARIRGNLLMALANTHGDLVLATGNKSELAVGYATIYGDMCGGYAPLKDCYKTRIYRLAKYCNRATRIIPARIIERPPSAELAEDQTDQDTLPAYEELDTILERYIERDESIADIVTAGHDEETVRFVARKVLQSEFKRRQGAPGPRITPRAFGRDRRYPITSGWRE